MINNKTIFITGGAGFIANTFTEIHLQVVGLVITKT
jgi:FlaA1/EpsC-like NDP-sugar epimerase